MGKSRPPSEREAVILASLVNRESYGREIRDAYQVRMGVSMPLGSLYVTLARMEEKGYLIARYAATTSDRGDNRRKYFRLSAKGRRALSEYGVRLGWVRGAIVPRMV